MKELNEEEKAKIKEIGERMKHTIISFDIKFPIEVTAVKVYGVRHGWKSESIGSWVSVRPCVDNEGGKTFLGVYLGDLQRSPMYAWLDDTHEFEIYPDTNPAMWVPELKRIVWGMESWWGVIDSADDLRKITDADIQNIWYVRALKELSDKESKAV